MDLGGIRNSRTDQKHGCVSANVSRFRVKVGVKPRTMCVQAGPELRVFLFNELWVLPTENYLPCERTNIPFFRGSQEINRHGRGTTSGGTYPAETYFLFGVC